VPGIKPGPRPYLHSHMLGCCGWRNAGIGRRLKLRQRQEALERRIELIEWTFDPLELKNAFFNLERLGAVVRQYAENQYGVTASPCTAGCPRTLHRRMVDRFAAHAAMLAGETVARGSRSALSSGRYRADSQPRPWPRA